LHKGTLAEAGESVLITEEGDRRSVPDVRVAIRR